MNCGTKSDRASLRDQVGAFIGVWVRPRRVHSGVESPDCDCCLSFKACQKEGTFARHSGRMTVMAISSSDARTNSGVAHSNGQAAAPVRRSGAAMQIETAATLPAQV